MPALKFKIEKNKLPEFEKTVKANLSHHGIDLDFVKPLEDEVGGYLLSWTNASFLARAFSSQSQERVERAIVKAGGEVEQERRHGIFEALFQGSHSTPHRR